MFKQRRVFIPLLIAMLCGVGATLVSKVKTDRAYDWKDVEEKTDNTVVQILSNHTTLNWLEPYKAPKQSQSFGTGFFIDDKGTLLTNFHVVENAKTLQVYVPKMGQKPVDAEIVGVCPEADVALIRLKEDGVNFCRKCLKTIPFLTLGDSDALFPTEPVLALGYPLGQRYLKSTVGVVAGREYIGGHSFMHITAPINPGNSGGPLLNLDGLVVGINSAIMPDSQNIGYIVPIYDAQILLKDLARQKLVRKPNLGIKYNTTTDEHADLLGNPHPAGVYINNVEKSSVADKAGIKSGDMLYAINGYAIDAYGDVDVNWQSSSKVTLEEFLVRLPLNEKLTLRIFRNGTEKIIKCIYSAPVLQSVRFVYSDYEPQEIDYEIVGGMCVMQLRANHLDFFERLIPLYEYRLMDNQHKEVLIITKLLPGSVIHKVNCFYEGALLTEVNGKEVKNLKELRNALTLSANTGLLSLKTKDKIATAVSVDALLKDEERIARDFMFSSTQGMKDLKKSRDEFLRNKNKGTLASAQAKVPKNAQSRNGVAKV